MKAIEQHSPLVLFITLCNVVLTFTSVDETPVCDHSNECYWSVLPCGTVYYAVQICSSFILVGGILGCGYSNNSYRVDHRENWGVNVNSLLHNSKDKLQGTNERIACEVFNFGDVYCELSLSTTFAISRYFHSLPRNANVSFSIIRFVSLFQLTSFHVGDDSSIAS